MPPEANRLTLWEFDRELYKSINEVERLRRRLRGFPRIFSRFGKLDRMLMAFILPDVIFDALIYLNRI